MPSGNLSKFLDGNLMNFYCLETEQNSACQMQAKMSTTVLLMTEVSSILIMVYVGITLLDHYQDIWLGRLTYKTQMCQIRRGH